MPVDGEEDPRLVAVEFKSTILRVGSPWANCDESHNVVDEITDVGVILPAFFGRPTPLSSGSRYADDYQALLDDLDQVDVPVSVVLEIFTEERGSWGSFTWSKVPLPEVDPEDCTAQNVDFVMGEYTSAHFLQIADDITKDLAKIGITVNQRVLPHDEYIA